jgi:predicted dehydrogenase
MRPPTRLLIVGFGVRGHAWADVILEGSRGAIHAIVEPRQIAMTPGALTYASLEAALEAGGVDGAIVASPPNDHRAAVDLCVSAGVPVLCEKPLSDSMEEAAQMAIHAEAASVPLLVGMNFRYVPAVQELRRLIANKAMGELLYGDFRYVRNRNGKDPRLNDYPLRMENPMLLEQSIHHLDLIRYAYGREARAVSALSWNPTTSMYAGDSCVAATIRLEGGVNVSYLGTWTSGSNRLGYSWRTDISQGLLVHSDPFGDLFRSRIDRNFHVNSWDAEPENQPLEPLHTPRCRPFFDDARLLLDHFLDVVEFSQEPEPTARDHCKSLALLQACLESCSVHAEVRVTPILPQVDGQQAEQAQPQGTVGGADPKTSNVPALRRTTSRPTEPGS